MTSLKTAAKGTNRLNILKKYVKFRFQLIAYKTRFPIINLFKRSSACGETGYRVYINDHERYRILQLTNKKKTTTSNQNITNKRITKNKTKQNSQKYFRRRRMFDLRRPRYGHGGLKGRKFDLEIRH